MKKTTVCLLLLFALLLLGILILLPDNQGPEQIGKTVIIALLIASAFVVLRRSPAHAVYGRRQLDQIALQSVSSDISFDDVAANEAALSSLRELVDYLKHPDRYLRMDARMPRGVLLYGPP